MKRYYLTANETPAIFLKELQLKYPGFIFVNPAKTLRMKKPTWSDLKPVSHHFGCSNIEAKRESKRLET